MNTISGTRGVNFLVRQREVSEYDMSSEYVQSWNITFWAPEVLKQSWRQEKGHFCTQRNS